MADHRDVPIADVSRQLGVPMPTLRSWEARYSIPSPPRELGRHRRYSAQELHILKLMRDEIARGTRAGVAAQVVKASLGQEGPAADFVKAMLEASRRLDGNGIREQLDGAVRELGLAATLEEVLFPALRQVGVWWHVGRCDVEQERLTTEAARAWMDRLTSYAPTPVQTRPIVLACGPGDLHTVGLEALCLSLRQRRWSCRLLGARTTPVALGTAIVANRAAAAVVASHLSSGRQRAVASLQVATDLGVDVFYAGNAFATPRSRVKVPGRYLGPRISDACDLIIASLRSSRGKAS
jgi:DNA-binding transcriptional MerR regulator